MNGLYGTLRPAIINPSRDVEIQYSYKVNRGDSNNVFETLDTSCLETVSGATTGLLNGLYSLRLPLSQFNKPGIYTIYIKPREIETTIWDIGVLAADPQVMGVVFKSKDFDTLINGTLGGIDLSGYRIEYYDNDGNHTGMSRLVTTSNPCEQIRMYLSDGYAKSIRYNLNSSSSSGLLFCTVTPSTASSFKPNSIPSIGAVDQVVHVVNTKFNPVLMEVELVEHDASTITTLLSGDQIMDLDNGIITTYNDNKEIFKQHEYYTLKSANGTPLYDVKVKRDDIDESQAYDNIITE